MREHLSDAYNMSAPLGPSIQRLTPNCILATRPVDESRYLYPHHSYYAVSLFHLQREGSNIFKGSYKRSVTTSKTMLAVKQQLKMLSPGTW